MITRANQAGAKSNEQINFSSLNEKINALLDNQVTKKYFDDRLKKLEDRIDHQETKLVEVDTRLQTVESSVALLPDNIYTEMQDQELRKKNIMIFNLPEPISNDKKDRFKQENEIVRNILIDIEATTQNQQVHMKLLRLGKATADDKIRPLRVTFRSAEFRERVLMLRRNLKDHESWTDISIAPDLTKIQQNLSKRKRNEMIVKAAANNSKLSDEEKQNGIEWKVLGSYMSGNLRLAKVTQQPQEPEQ